MPERRIKIPFPMPTSPLQDGVEVSVKETTERWSEVTLEDGSILRLKPSVLSAVRIEGQWDPEGNPMYAIKAGQILMVSSAPEHLRRAKSGRAN